jgi:Ca-activated chloride channel family protein
MSEILPTRDDYEDRLTDQALAEVLGGKRPPDLSDDILAAAKRPRWHARRLPRLAMAASVLIAAGAGVAFYLNRGGDAVQQEPLLVAGKIQSAQSVKLNDSRSWSESRSKSVDERSLELAYPSTPVPATTLEIAERVDAYGLDGGVATPDIPRPAMRSTPDEPPILYPSREHWYHLSSSRDVTAAALGSGENLDRLGDRLGEIPELQQRTLYESKTPWGNGPGQAGDQYSRIVDNPFLAVTQNPLSTFSIDVDTASYAKTRRYLLEANMLPPSDAVRIEELVNYFSYDYPAPEGDQPFSAHVEVAACPWQAKHRLLRVGLKGKEIQAEDRPASNLVFLLDVSGSMEPEDRLPRVRRAMRMLVEQLGENDRVAIVVYAGASGLVLPSTPGYQKEKILTALENLQAGGSTNGAAGIQLAYDTAAAHLIKGGTNRVVLCTDGDVNVGVTSTADLERIAEEKAKSGVFLTVLGFGMGNHNDDLLEKLADKGNGNYGYVDSEQEAKKLLVDELGGTLLTIAKDVKIQIEFNPRQVASYRLIGYENRLLRAEDFNDDKKDAGEIGAGHSVTALYELVPADGQSQAAPVDELKYQEPHAATDAATSGELLTLKLRYKDPEGQESHEPLVFPIKDGGHSFGQASADFKFASAVASFGMQLRNSEHKGETSYDAVLEIATASLGSDEHGYRAGFLELVRKAKQLAGK